MNDRAGKVKVEKKQEWTSKRRRKLKKVKEKEGGGWHDLPNTALKFLYPVILTQPDVLLGKISTWSTVQTGLMKSFSPCHVVLNGSYTI